MDKTLRSYLEDYINFLLVECGLEEETVRSYLKEIQWFEAWLKKNGHPLEPEGIRVRHIRGYLAYLKNERGNSPVTRNRKLTVLKGYFNFLVSREVIEEEENPLLYIKRAKEPKKLPVYLTLEESETLLEATRVNTSSPVRDHAIMRVFLQTGLRLGELVEAKVSDINLEEMEMKVRGKGRKERIVPLTENTCRALAEYLEVREPAFGGVDALFLNYRGFGLSKSGIRRIFNRACREAGLLKPHLSVMKLRHTCLTLLLNEGVELVVLRDLAGHETVRTTRIYTHVSQKQLRQAVEKLPLG